MTLALAQVVFEPEVWRTYQPLLRADFTLFDQYQYTDGGAGHYGENSTALTVVFPLLSVRTPAYFSSPIYVGNVPSSRSWLFDQFHYADGGASPRAITGKIEPPGP
jgi:hypothetical protein